MPDLVGRKRFAHLYRRAGFGASEVEINQAMALHLNEDTAYGLAVDRLVDYEWVPEVPDRLQPDATLNGCIRWWLERMLHTSHPLAEKMTFFWHDHFATSAGKDGIDMAIMIRQNNMMRMNSLGNFEQMLRDVSRDPAMLYWLDLIFNRKSSPNENWARELLELFTFGVGTPQNPNYSEADIREATKAFTGYSLDINREFFLNTAEHDSSTKTVLGQPCNTGDSVLRILMSHRKGGRYVLHDYICYKLFNYFAYPVPIDSQEVAMLSDVFINRNSIRDVMSKLLRSNEFQSNRCYRALVKSPVEVAVGSLRMLGAERLPGEGASMMLRLIEQGQWLFQPRDVSGWPSGRAWITAQTILSRSSMCASVINSLGNTSLSEAGGPLPMQLLSGAVSGSQKVDRVLGLLVDGDVSSSTRQALVTYANGASTDEQHRGLFNLVMALPQFQLK